MSRIYYDLYSVIKNLMNYYYCYFRPKQSIYNIIKTWRTRFVRTRATNDEAFCLAGRETRDVRPVHTKCGLLASQLPRQSTFA